jgi:ubiquinone/menaquinone biosynthesis C-methylase UbiE
MNQSSSLRLDHVIDFYASGYEEMRLSVDTGRLECERTRELLIRFLPSAPAVVLDVGGGAGAYACWLAKRGYEVHMTDISPVLVERAHAASNRQPEAPLASAAVGDARLLSWTDNTTDAVLLLGPLYHLTAKEDRLRALKEAYRVLKPGGVLCAVGISRFASILDGLRTGNLKDQQFAAIVDLDLKDGQHRNPTSNPQYFTDAYLHLPDQLRHEIEDTGFAVSGMYGIEGPGWIVHNFDEWWANPAHREALMKVARSVETEPSIIGVSAHIMVVASKSSQAG